MKQKKFFLLCLFLCTTTIYTEDTPKKATRGIKKTSISPGDILSFKHYLKYLGDPNTKYGDFFNRSYIFGYSKGIRESMADHGIYVDATVFQFLGTTATGGVKTGLGRYNGNAEYWFVIDTGKAGLWPKGALMLHAESSWTVEDSINGDVGSILAANSRSRYPVPTASKTTLSEVALMQEISKHFKFRVGKLNASGPIEQTNFANNARFQFIYAGLVNNPIISIYVSYTSMGILPFWTPNEKNQVIFYIADAEGQADKSGLDTAFNGNTSYCLQYQFSPTINKNLPGNYRIIYGHVKRPITSYQLDEVHIIGENIGKIMFPKKCSNQAWMINFDQYVWINPHNEHVKDRKFRPPVGVLFFGRAGWTAKDRNVIDQFYSIGVGSYGGFNNRYYDQWGVGYAATHISSILRADLKKKNVIFNAFEHAFEAFYNFEITPSIHLTLNAQVIRTPVQSRCASLVFNSRLKTDF